MTTPLPILDQTTLPPPREGDGFGALETASGCLPLEALSVTGKVTGLVYELEVVQTFKSVGDEPIEATYVFPLPDRAAVTSFRMEIGDRLVEGVLEERAAAREHYQEAIEAGHRAALAEEDRSGVFTLAVGNLMPGDRATIHLSLTGRLAYEDGEATFRFPLVVAPRYIPGTPLPGPSVGEGTEVDTDAVPDASRITPPVLLPGFPSPVRLSISLDVDPAGLSVTNLRSSLPAVTASDGARHHVTVTPGQRLDRDLIVRFGVAGEKIGTGLVVGPADEKGTRPFALTLVPPAVTGAKPRDVVFLLDRSGSMDGFKMVAARRAVARMVDSLDSRDRFTVIAFDNEISTPGDPLDITLTPATDRDRFEAVGFLANIEARGGTEMAMALERATDVFDAAGDTAGRLRTLVLVTDGQVGDEDRILALLAKRLGGVRIFTLGIDSAVNAGFLHRLAAIGGGRTDLVESEDRLDEVMDRIHRRIATPVLDRLSLKGVGVKLDADSLTPGRLPAVFDGAPLVVLGRLKGEEGAIVVRAKDAAGASFNVSVPAEPSDRKGLDAEWARAWVRDLEDRFAARMGDTYQLEKQIIATSIAHSVLSRFTAFVAIDRAEVVNEGGRVHRVVQPVEAPSDWEMFASPATRAFGAPAPMAAGGAMPPRMAKRSAMTLAGAPPAAPAPAAPQGAPGGSNAPISLDAYRARAREALDAQDTEGGDMAKLRALVALLEVLVDDLRSVLAPKKTVAALEKALAAAHKALSGSEAAAAGALEKVVAAVAAFADGSDADEAGGEDEKAHSRLAFWKR